MKQSSRFTPRALRITLLALTLLAFALRLWQLGRVPPGWRDDELINSLVISQKVLNGDLAVYYADASGHEALYHALNALFLGVFGPGVAGIRLLSVILGTTAVPLTYLLGKRLFGPLAGFTAAAGLTFSFWSLMYSRMGLRHILMPLLTVAAFYFFWRGVETGDRRLGSGQRRLVSTLQLPITNYLFTALFISLGFYTYFAGRGAPLILLAFIAYVFLVDRERFKQNWRGWAALLGVTAVLIFPLLSALSQQPESDARVAELAVPLVEAQAGNFEPLWNHIRITLSMFHSDGDDEWLYNIPHRPVFGPIGAIFFWAGVAIALWRTLKPILSRSSRPASRDSLAAAFLLLWWLAGISPGFISVPPGSLGHTILAQPAVYLLAALPVWKIKDLRLKIERERPPIINLQSSIFLILTAVLLFSIAGRDLPDYFVNWPQRGMVRFLYRADIQELTDFLNSNPAGDIGVAGLLAGPWDRLAFEIGLQEDIPVTARWFNPERAILLQPPRSFTIYPGIAETYADWYEPMVNIRGEAVQGGGYALNRIVKEIEMAEPVCFVNGLCWVYANYYSDSHVLELGWQVGRELDLPDQPLISNPPPPGMYAGPRLKVFGQLWDADGDFLTGDDGLWVDPTTLQLGDIFVQQHWLNPPQDSGAETAVFGLYDPMTNERILTEDGRDHLRLEIGD